MFRNLFRLGKVCGSPSSPASNIILNYGRCLQIPSRQFNIKLSANWPETIKPFFAQGKTLPLAMGNRDILGIARTGYSEYPKEIWTQPRRQFHAAGSKVHYMDFRHRLRVNHLRLHLLIIRRQKMKKHRRRKFRRKFKALLAKQRLKREIAKEKTFRVELLSMIRKAENFDPREYALQKIAEINNKPKELTSEEKLEQLKQLIRVNRYQVDYIKPKHRRSTLDYSK